MYGPDKREIICNGLTGRKAGGQNSSQEIPGQASRGGNCILGPDSGPDLHRPHQHRGPYKHGPPNGSDGRYRRSRFQSYQ